MPTQPAEPMPPDGVASVHLSADLDTADRIMTDRDVSALVVLDAADRPVGVISRTDLLRAGRLHSVDGQRVALHLPKQRVEQQMRAGVITVSADDGPLVAARAMVEHRVHRVFVLTHGRITGVVSTRELASNISQLRLETPVRKYATRSLITVDVRASLGDAIDKIHDSSKHGLVVVEDGWPVGLFTQREALAARAMPAATPLVEAMSFSLVCVPEATPLWRAAGHAVTSRARRVLTVDSHHSAVGILSGIDFAQAYLDERST